jgi:TPR repeat protein
MRLADPDPHSLEPLAEGLAQLRAPEPDLAQAVYWFQVAADAGDADGLAMLAVCQLEGQGTPRDPVQARERLERASAGGSLTAKYQLGRVLVAGWGGPADAPRGMALYTAAAAQGHADATFQLASCLDAGWGCLPDRLAAKALFMRARALGSTLRMPGLRIRQRELEAVRALARRFELAQDLPALIEERQHELSLMQELVHGSGSGRRLTPTQKRRRLLRVASATALLIGLAAALAALTAFLRHGASAPLAHDAGPTSFI